MQYTKQRNENHLIDADGEKLLRECLPRHWVLREYRPDYGLDFAMEIFEEIVDDSRETQSYQTLGEHIFIQLKSVQKAEFKALHLYSRVNVEKQKEVLDKKDKVCTIDTLRFQLETSELLTVEKMGTGIPVLLVVADLSEKKCYFVCLNDYIDKILIPRHDDYTSKNSRVIHIPSENQVNTIEPGTVALQWYAKRAKLYSAFQRFLYQEAELKYSTDLEKGIELAKYFATKIIRYDFWESTKICPIIEHYGKHLRLFLTTGRSGLFENMSNEEIGQEMEWIEIVRLWESLTLLSRNYEDVWREWFLPTSLGYLSSSINA
ncbi:MAG: hypothetical protein BA863_10660 [Desulfovibrio sp. S3730MH75]|nr:MAG: hypothetical protein BA863_10660 [Desulfovibrio sp. S3730MH75]